MDPIDLMDLQVGIKMAGLTMRNLLLQPHCKVSLNPRLVPEEVQSLWYGGHK